ncbi:hypothetical protein [Sessilibacter sp. MAH2]
MSIDFEDWEIDLKNLSATHPCGFTISVEGSPRNPSVVHPGPFPKHLSALDQVRLLRHGVEAIAKASRDSGDVGNSRYGNRREHQAKVVKKPSGNSSNSNTGNRDNGNRAKKPLLSLKKKNEDSQSDQ